MKDFFLVRRERTHWLAGLIDEIVKSADRSPGTSSYYGCRKLTTRVPRQGALIVFAQPTDEVDQGEQIAR
jgi:hypothetical protein